MEYGDNKIEYFDYARKSSEGKEKQVLSIPDQIDWAKETASRCRIKVVDYLREEKSAETPYRRPVFDDLVKRIKTGEAQGIITWKLDRLARNPEEAGIIIGMLKRGEIKHIITNEREYTPADNAIISYVDFGMADQYVRDLSKNVKRGLKSKLDKGWMPGTAPIGYLNSKTEARGENYILKDEERFPLIRKCWDLMLTGNYVATEILDMLNNKWGFRTRQWKRRGGKPMSRSTIYRIFTNAFYAGIIPYKGLFIEGKHEPMITVEEFDRVQLILGRDGKPRPNRYKYAYNGLPTCGECGGFISATFQEKIIKKTGKLKQYILYYCVNARKHPKKCSQRNYTNVEVIEGSIEKELMELEILPEIKDWAISILEEEGPESGLTEAKIENSKKSALDEAEKQKVNLVKMRMKDMIEDEVYNKEKAEVDKTITKLKVELKNQNHQNSDLTELTKKTFVFAAYAHKAMFPGDHQTKRDILASIGLNQRILNNKLLFEGVEWLQPIKEKYPTIKNKYDAFELEKTVDIKRQKEVFASLSPMMRGVVNEVRTTIMTDYNSILIADTREMDCK